MLTALYIVAALAFMAACLVALLLIGLWPRDYAKREWQELGRAIRKCVKTFWDAIC